MIKKLLCFALIFASLPLFAQSDWTNFIAGLRSEAIAKGIRPNVFDEAFAGIHAPHQAVLRFDRTQPERRISYIKYRHSRASKDRILIGRQEMRKHGKLLQTIAAHYGVNPCFIVSLWGLETSYGRFMGSFPVIQSLATLAYDHRRGPIFRRELFYALEMLNNGDVSLHDLKGEWAGATGQPQFLPSTWHHHAVDYNGDGHKDIWRSYGDIFASIANYLSYLGWQANQPWTVNVNLPVNFDHDLLSLKVIKTVSDWEHLGVRLDSNEQINSQLPASIIHPDGGPIMMVFNNFRVIMKWNHSTYYAGTVGYMANEICH